MLDIAVDIGGTFTDVVAVRDGRQVFATKVPSTPADLAIGVLQGIDRVLAIAANAPGDVRRFVHGSTVATNAVIERKGATTALLATAGFEDVLEIGRLKRTRMYDLFMDQETPTFIAPRRRRFGIRERIDSRGTVITPLDEQQVVEAVRQAVDTYAVQSIAVCYLFSFLNPSHEARTRDLIREVAPGVAVSLSSEVHPVLREYERTVVTAFDAYVRPVIEQYLRILKTRLAALGVRARVQVMQSRGGVSSVRNALDRPVTTLLSGPAGGVVGGKFEAARSGYRNLVSLDMGGTSCDVAVVLEGRPLTTTESRFETFPLSIPMVDVNSIGAGGGSIVWLDRVNSLRVGPQSAGSDPGPACYGRGGKRPTVTDASLLLGYLNQTYFAGGELRLDPEAASLALGPLASELRMDVRDLALGVHRVTNARMADQLRLMSVRRGLDPRTFPLVVFGGAGPVHGGLLASALGMPAVLVPSKPGVLSAFGLLVSAIEHDQSRSFVQEVTRMDAAELEQALAELQAIGSRKMAAEDVPLERVNVLRTVDMRYMGQSYELEVPVPSTVNSSTPEVLTKLFHAAHERIYGHFAPESPVEVVNVRTVHSYAPDSPSVAVASRTGVRRELERKGDRIAIFPEFPRGTLTPVYERSALNVGDVLVGPAIVEQPDTTTVVYPNHTCTVDAVENLIISARKGAFVPAAPARETKNVRAG